MHNFLKIKYYFINKLDTNNIDKQDKQTIVIFRNYSSNKIDINSIIKIKNYCKRQKKKFYLSNNIKLAIKLKLDGVYIPSFSKNLSHVNYSLHKEFQIIGSAHNIKEIRHKELQKVNKIFISSIFKKNKNYLGINKFRIIEKYTKRKIVALGGISKRNEKKLNLVNSVEFAGISYFE